MNRLLGLLPRSGKDAIAFAPSVPLAMRGAIEVTSYAPSSLPQASEDLLLRVEQLYSRDAQLHALWSSALDARNMAGETRNEMGAAQAGRTPPRSAAWRRASSHERMDRASR